MVWVGFSKTVIELFSASSKKALCIHMVCLRRRSVADAASAAVESAKHDACTAATAVGAAAARDFAAEQGGESAHGLRHALPAAA